MGDLYDVLTPWLISENFLQSTSIEVPQDVRLQARELAGKASRSGNEEISAIAKRLQQTLERASERANRESDKTGFLFSVVGEIRRYAQECNASGVQVSLANRVIDDKISKEDREACRTYKNFLVDVELGIAAEKGQLDLDNREIPVRSDAERAIRAAMGASDPNLGRAIARSVQMFMSDPARFDVDEFAASIRAASQECERVGYPGVGLGKLINPYGPR